MLVPDKTINDFGIHFSCFALSIARDIVALRAIGKPRPAPIFGPRSGVFTGLV